MKYSKTLKVILKTSVAAVIVFFLGHSVLSNWEIIHGYDWSFQLGLMAASCAMFAAAYAFLPWIWRKLVQSCFFSFPEQEYLSFQ